MSARTFITRIKTFISEDVWTLNMRTLSRTKGWLVRDVRVVLNAIDNMNHKNVGLLSASLCYFCAMALVPFIAVCFAMTGGLGLTDRFKSLILDNFTSSTDLLTKVLEASDNIMKTAQSGVFGLLSALLFFWLIIWMMDRVEKVFNVIWDVPQPKKNRKVLKSYTIDLAIMLIAPFIILVFITGSVVYSNVLDYLLPDKVGFSEGIRTFLGWVIFWATTVITIAAMYKFIPTVKVRFRFALHAAALAGTAFTLLQYLYLETQLLVTRVNGVYGALAAIPLFLLWLRFGWLIIVLGVQFSYSFQKIDEGSAAADGADDEL